jgi:hypothetical protein
VAVEQRQHLVARLRRHAEDHALDAGRFERIEIAGCDTRVALAFELARPIFIAGATLANRSS